MIQSIKILRSWFLRGLYPTQDQFHDLFDSFWHKNEQLPVGDFKQIEYKQQDLSNILLTPFKQYLSVHKLDENTMLSFAPMTGVIGSIRLLLENTANVTITIDVPNVVGLVNFFETGTIQMLAGEYAELVLTGFGEYQTLSVQLKKKIIDQLTADPFEKGKIGSIYVKLSTTAYDHIGTAPYDFDNKVMLGANEGSYKTYKTIVIGELEWTSENLNVMYADRMGTSLSWVNLTQADINEMNQQYQEMDNVSLDKFSEINGTFITNYDTASSYRNAFEVYDVKEGSMLQGWDLPTLSAIYQLLGLAPKNSENILENINDFLFASQADVGAAYTADWFSYKNISGLGLTPLGRRSSAPEGEPDGAKYFGYKVVCGLKLKDYPEGQINFFESKIAFYTKLYHFCQARYCRALTDEELGYKLYVDAENDVVLMVDLSTPLLLPELPKGVERGVALRYANRQHKKILKKWSEIEVEAKAIKEKIYDGSEQ